MISINILKPDDGVLTLTVKNDEPIFSIREQLSKKGYAITEIKLFFENQEL
jgi:hypothetical protein